MSQKNIVIIGGGYAGLNAIPKLQGSIPSSYRIVLIEQQDFFYVKLGAARAAASEDISDQILVPYDRLFKSPEAGVVVKASVTKINPHSVVLSEPHKLLGREIDFEYLVHFRSLRRADHRLSPLAALGMIQLSFKHLQKRMLWRCFQRGDDKSRQQKIS
jgi:NADH dehydrogenase FAD-containing subunit